MNPFTEERISKIMQLVAFVRDPSPPAKTIHFEWYEPLRDGACLQLDPESGMCTVQSWLESGHNGSSYDERTRQLSESDASRALITIERRLFELARKKVREQESDEQRRAEAKALDDRTMRAVFGTHAG